MKRFLIIGTLVAALVLSVMYLTGARTAAPEVPATDEQGSDTSYVPQLPASPLDATYRIDDEEVLLSGGAATVPSAPGSASVEEVRVWGEPVMEDIDGNGREDAVVLLTKQSGGSGTFYYVSAALGGEDGYVGLNAVYLGDRIAPQNVLVRDEMIIVNYADRLPDQPFSEQPSVGVSAYVTLVGAMLTRVDVFGERSAVLSGHIVYGHEARTFTPCGGEAYWIAPSSRSRAALEAVYAQATLGKEPYSPVYAVVVGTVGEAPEDGFGADYAYSIDIQQLLAAPAQGTCAASSTPQGE
jgi:hypothetical protein